MKKNQKYTELIPIELDKALSNIQKCQYILPSFQRDFVWDMEHIENLFSSIYLGYPIGTFLFWNIYIEKNKHSLLKKEPFYAFIENFNMENNDISSRKRAISSQDEHWVVLDGQQRLTSLNIGLKGSYKKRERYQRKERKEFPNYHLYMLISEETDNPFKFIKEITSKKEDCFIDEKTKQKWLLVKTIYDVETLYDLEKSYEFTKDEYIRVSSFKEKLNNLKINYFELSGFDYDEATNIFVRVNSGGIKLEMSDILNAIIVSTWRTEDAKEEFKNLIKSVEESGFKININYIVKAILFLFHSDVRFKIQDFTNFINTIEGKWKGIKSAIIDTFNLMKSYGLNSYTLSGNNITLPVLYYLYYRQIKNPVTITSFSDDRTRIKQWINSAIIMRVFGNSSDTVLTKIRKVFIAAEKVSIEKCEKDGTPFLYSSSKSVVLPIKQSLSNFPSEELIKELDDDWYISDDGLEELITETQKGDRYSLPILSLLYPSYDLNAVNYEQDHLHPIDRYEEMPNEFRDNKENKKLYNSIVNLQLLQKEENAHKKETKLKDWFEEKTKGYDDLAKKDFQEEHLIPNVSLDESDITKFFEERKKLLVSKLKEKLKLL